MYVLSGAFLHSRILWYCHAKPAHHQTVGIFLPRRGYLACISCVSATVFLFLYAYSYSPLLRKIQHMKSHIYKWDQLQAILHNTNVAFFFLLFKWVNSLGFIKWLTLGTYNYLLSTYYAPGILTATVCLSEMWVQWRHDPRSSKTWLYFSRMCQSRGRQNVLALELAT